MLDRYRAALADALGQDPGLDWDALIAVARRTRAERNLAGRQLTDARADAFDDAAALVAEEASGSIYGRALPGRIRALATSANLAGAAWADGGAG
jgi:hypothetical protein